MVRINELFNGANNVEVVDVVISCDADSGLGHSLESHARTRHSTLDVGIRPV